MTLHNVLDGHLAHFEYSLIDIQNEPGVRRFVYLFITYSLSYNSYIAKLLFLSLFRNSLQLPLPA